MAFDIDNNGNITCVQGDNGELSVNGLPTDKNYTLYFAIQDEKKHPIGAEIAISTLQQSSVVVVIPATLTDLLTVKDEFETYYYGIKLCDSFGLEDTLLLGNSKIGDVNTITVFPKKVEGLLNG